MAYKKAELEATALDAIKKHNLVFIEDVVSFLPCDKTTFYKHKLNESNGIKDALDFNKVRLKVNMRKKWYESDNPALQMGLYKLIGTEEESDRLSGKQKIEHSGGVEVSAPVLNVILTNGDSDGGTN